MKIMLKNSVVTLSEKTGSVTSYKIKEKEILADGGEKRPLFTLKLLDNDGNPVYCNSLEAQETLFEQKENGAVIRFNKIGGADLSAVVTVSSDEGIKWHLSVENNTGMIMEWSEYPQITVRNELKGNNGEFELFWPAMEGVVIDKPELRHENWKYQEIGGQTGGYCGFYPGSCPMQFMAFYGGGAGLYFAAHDDKHNPKTVEYREDKDGIALEFRLFTEGVAGSFDMSYDMVTDEFEGDWYGAAEIYRSWMQSSVKMPKKLCENTKLPKWIEDSPIVVLYPIRGTKDSGDMTPNMYYPYKNVLPIVDSIAEKTNSRVMALPMHWEGPAPWCTPYVWPPYGGEEQFTEFVSALHEKGNLAGVYCSGIGWTEKSFNDPTLDFSDRYDESLLCKTPKGTIEYSKVIGEPIRLGYDMCPYKEKVDEIVSGEVMSIAASGCDYAQYFDQNLGGESCFCYAKDHGHPPAPGLWQNDSMIRIFKKVNADLEAAGSSMIIGCEGAASEPFIGYLPFNDLRYNVGLFLGKPVPAYSYLFHEYLNNFMGNQNTIQNAVDLEKNPDCLLYRIAYSFAAGDMLTVCLADEGKIHFGWDVLWDDIYPEQEPIYTLMNNLNSWHTEMKEFLRYGKMIKPEKTEGTKPFMLIRKKVHDTECESVVTNAWQSPDGRKMQIIVNFLKEEQTVSINCKSVVAAPGEKPVKQDKITIPALSAVWVEL